VEFVAGDVDCLHLLVGNFDPPGIEISIDLAADLKACIGCGGADQLHNHLMADQRLATPVHGDEGEQPVFDLVPLAGAGRQVRHGDLQTDLVGEALEFAFP
jgi:hypothetical protein